MVVIILGT